MTLADFATILYGTGLPAVYLSFGENDCPDMPFLTWFETGSDNFAADGKVYHQIRQVQVDLWTKNKDLNAEATLETAFNNAGLFWNKEMNFDENESAQQTTYSLEF